MTVHLSNHHLRHGGGIERYALTLVRGLHQRGIRPVFAAKSFDRELPEYGWVDPVAVAMLGLPAKLRDRWFDWRLRRLKRAGGWFPLIACNQTGAADLAISGSNHPAYLHAMGLPTRRSDRWKIALEREHLRNARVVVAHSAALARDAVHHHGVDADKVRLLYPPVDGDRFAPADEDRRQALRKALGLPEDRAVFLLASTGHRRKGLAEMAAHFAATGGDALLVVAGRPIDLEGPNVRYLGYRTDMEEVYRAVDFTVLASRYEPFGLVGVESVLSGTPVLVADCAGCAEVLAPPAGLLFSLDDRASFGAAFATALDRFRHGTHRLADPRRQLGYDPSVDVHLDALLGWSALLVA